MSVATITKDQFKECLPKSLKNSVTDDMVNHINKVIIDHPYAEQFRDNVLGFIDVMKDGKFKVSDYLNAVQYVSHKLLGSTNIAAYSKTFPDKIKKWQQEEVSAKDISAYVAAYNKTKLVQAIFEYTVTPVWVLNMDIYQEAINTQAEIMRTARSDKVRSDAANSLMTHLKRPEAAKIDLSVSNPAAESAISALEETTKALLEQQKQMMLNGLMNAQQVAHSNILGKVIEHDDSN